MKNMVQLSRNMRFRREIYEVLKKIDDDYKAYFDFGMYLENEDSISEGNYHHNIEEKLKETKERTQSYYCDNLRRIVSTLKIEVLFELAYINMRFEVPIKVLREKSSRYYLKICNFIKDAILEHNRAYEILR